MTFRRMRVAPSTWLPLLLWLAACRSAPHGSPRPPRPSGPPPSPLQTERGERLRYELLDPASHEFRVTYELAATTAGARFYCTPARGDTFVSEVKATDLFTEEALDVGLVGGADARELGHPAADEDATYFAVELGRPVPENGEVRLRIEAKYEDRGSYEFRPDPVGGDELSFARLLAANDVGVTLPKDYALVDLNQPARIEQLADGRLSLTYTKAGHAPVPLRVRARKVTWRERGVDFGAAGPPSSPSSPSSTGSTDPGPIVTASPAAQPLTAPPDPLQALRLELLDVDHATLECHVEVVAGALTGDAIVAEFASAVSDGSARACDTGRSLSLESIDPTHLRIDTSSLANRPSAPRVQVIALTTAHGLTRSSESRFGWLLPLREPTTVVLPAGWEIVTCSSPASITRASDGRQQLSFGAPGWIPLESNAGPACLLGAARVEVPAK